MVSENDYLQLIRGLLKEDNGIEYQTLKDVKAIPKDLPKAIKTIKYYKRKVRPYYQVTKRTKILAFIRIQKIKNNLGLSNKQIQSIGLIK